MKTKMYIILVAILFLKQQYSTRLNENIPNNPQLMPPANKRTIAMIFRTAIILPPIKSLSLIGQNYYTYYKFSTILPTSTLKSPFANSKLRIEPTALMSLSAERIKSRFGLEILTLSS